MSLKHEFNRIGHLFNGGVEKAEKHAGRFLQQKAQQSATRATELSRRMRRQVDTGARSAIAMEESIVRHIRQNPALYVMGAALLVGLIIARLILEARQTSRAPLL
jgi:hypothetical protein